MGIISIIALLLPVLLVLIYRLYRFKWFIALAVYFLLDFIYNLMTENYIPVSAEIKRYVGISINFLEFPLMFTFMTYFSYSATLTKRIRYSIPAFILFELLTILMFGYNRKAMIIIMAPGLSLLLFFSTLFALRQIKITITQGKSAGKALMASALLFGYGSYTLIYVLYYLMKAGEINEIFSMYFVASTFSVILLSIGIMIENKRIQLLEELKTTRKELNSVYDQKQNVKRIPIDPSVFDKNF